MSRNLMDMETMELYKKIPANGYTDNGYRYIELCSNCGQNDYEDVLRNIAVHRKKIRNYEKHCPSCHCPPERRKFSPSTKLRTLENVEAMLNRYEHAEPLSSAIKKSQSSPLSQEVCRHDRQISGHPRYLKRSLQNRRQRKNEYKYLSPVFRMKRDLAGPELNENFEPYCKNTQAIRIKNSMKKRNRCREPEVSPDEQELSDVESDTSIKYTQHVQQSRKSRVSNLKSRHRCIAKINEYVMGMKNSSDVNCQQNEREFSNDCREMKKFTLGPQDIDKTKQIDTTLISKDGKDGKEIEKCEIDTANITKPRTLEDVSYCATNKPSILIKESINKSMNKLVLDTSAHLTKLDFNSSRNHIEESIENVPDTMDGTKDDMSQVEQESIDKISRELQENGWQLLFNALKIHRNSANSNKRTIRLECLHHIQRELNKLYALESTLHNCLPKQSASSHDNPCNKERQEHKTNSCNRG